MNTEILTMNLEFKNIEDILKKYKIRFKNPEYSEVIVDIFNGKNIETQNPILLNLIGLYHELHTKNKELSEKYYLMSINLGNIDAISNLGVHYQYLNNYELMEKYYLMAIELGSIDAMIFLGHYYLKIQNYNLMEKYYLMAIDNNDLSGVEFLDKYYLESKQYEKYFKLHKVEDKLWCIIMLNINTIEITNFLNDEELKIYLLNIKNFKDLNERVINAYEDIFSKTPIFKHKMYILLKNIKKNKELITCPILLTDIENGYILNCGHKFSIEIFKCVKCPTCRKNIVICYK